MSEPMWERVEDDEYNLSRLVLDDDDLEVFSNRTGERWFARLGDGDWHDLDATEELAARREALRWFNR